MRSPTTVGSASVEVSPSVPNSPSAILRRIRRMILPERVFGRPGANWTASGEAMGDLAAHPGDELLAQRVVRLDAPHERHIGVNALAFEIMRIADDRGLGDQLMRDSALSISAVPRRWPETLITSSTRPVIQ